jgi:hypothetical protein
MRRLKLVTIMCFAAAPASAAAHFERPAYWPDPAPDTSVRPAAGGAVPVVRSLSSALLSKPPGRTRVVCKQDSLQRLQRSIRAARKTGYDIRPTDHRRLSARAARKLLRINRRLKVRCRFDEIQPAVTASHNNDRVVVMPGIYTEPTARAQPSADPACDQYRTTTEFGDPGALSYAYHVHCPNDQNLIAVIGRAAGRGQDPSPPPADRHGIPNLGPCTRCNMQIEGSGVSADDVVIDAGRVESGNGGPHGAKKEIGIRADRADGFVLRNVTVRHGLEHAVYVLESDGYVLDRIKLFYNGLYGVLTFVEDHGVVQNCEAAGNGDSGVYPGASAETGAQRAAGTTFRYNQEIRWCDLHHNLAGFSGTDANALHIHDNDVYDNALGLQVDVLGAAGHPGFPGDSILYEHNQIHANNFNPYAPGSDVKPALPYPVGTGMWIAGGNNHIVRENRIYDNWRRGAMLFTIPDAVICPPGGAMATNCDFTKFSTSHNNAFHDNLMGVAPGGRVAPNGTDFWWDSFPGSHGNCWYSNSGPRPITSSPGPLPDCDGGKNPGSSVGLIAPANEAELIRCLTVLYVGLTAEPLCPWFASPPKPQLPANARRDFYVSLSRFNCSHWRRAAAATRASVLRRLVSFVGGRVSGKDAFGFGTVLPAPQAIALFDDRCNRVGTGGFLLYKLYAWAAGFSGVAPSIQ